jgi:hypothetical protein
VDNLYSTESFFAGNAPFFAQSLGVLISALPILEMQLGMETQPFGEPGLRKKPGLKLRRMQTNRSTVRYIALL